MPSGIAALAVATMPIWMTLFGWLLFKTDSLTKRIILGLVLGFIGIGLLLGPGQIFGPSTFNLSSLLILMMAPILWSFGSLYSREAKLPSNIFMSTAMEMLIGGVLLMIAALLTGEVNQLNIAEISTRSVASMLYLTIFGSIVALTAYVWLLKNVLAARVVTYTYINPIIAVFLGWFVFREPITALTLVAVAVITAAVILITQVEGNGLFTGLSQTQSWHLPSSTPPTNHLLPVIREAGAGIRPGEKNILYYPS